MQNLVNHFHKIIEKIELLTKSKIKVICFDFDCTLTSIHTQGSFSIYNANKELSPSKIEKMFINTEFIKSLFESLKNNNYELAVASHSDVRYSRLGRIGGMELIINSLNHITKKQWFDHNNVISFSNITEGVLGNKNIHINALIRNLNLKRNTELIKLENVLFFDDSINNVVNGIGYHSIYTRYQEEGLSFSSSVDKISRFISILEEQVDEQYDKYGIFSIYKRPIKLINITHNGLISSQKIDVQG